MESDSQLALSFAISSPDVKRVLSYGLAPLTITQISIDRGKLKLLDTADWRLDRSGSRLELMEMANATRLRLDCGSGCEATGRFSLSGRRRGAYYPASFSPIGFSRRVLRLSGGRPVSEVASVNVGLEEFHVLNLEGKSIARVEILDLVQNKHLWIRWKATKGSEVLATAIHETIRSAFGDSVRHGQPCELWDFLLQAQGRWKRDYSSGFNVALSPLQSASSAYSKLLFHLLVQLRANIEGVMSDVDSEYLHDLRVALRRTRACLPYWSSTLGVKSSNALSSELSQLARGTTELRDLDVLLSAIQSRRILGVEDEAIGVILQKRNENLSDLKSLLQSQWFAEVQHNWSALAVLGVDSIGGVDSGAIEDVVCAHAVASRRRVDKTLSRIASTQNVEHLHELRKRIKEHRYLLEAYSSLLDPFHLDGYLSELKSLQGILGDFQDAVVQNNLINQLLNFMPAEDVANVVIVPRPGPRSDKEWIDYALRLGLPLLTKESREGLMKAFKIGGNSR